MLEMLLSKVAAQQYPTACLYVVATPIGNIGDITVRALHVLSQVDAIACEDTRHSRTLLAQWGIDKPLIAAHEHNEQQAAQGIVARLAQGERIALISDAGTPAISDPGARLVAAVRRAGYRVMPLPGASAVVCALSAAGQEGAFTFVGFLPPKAAARQASLDALKSVSHCLVFYESPHRLHETLRDMAAIFPEREITIARELSKLYESFNRVALAQMAQWLADAPAPRGEYVLMIHGVAGEQTDSSGLAWQGVLTTLLPLLPLKQAVAVTCQLTSAAKNEVYAFALQLKNQTGSES